MKTQLNSSHSSQIGHDLPRFLSLKDIMFLVGKSKSTIWRWVGDESFPKPVKICGSTMWTEESFLEWREAVVMH